MTGRPKPTAIKRLTGNPGKRPLNAAEPQPDKTPPTCPAWLTGEARREWRRIVPELERMGLLTLVDRAALSGYCQSWARWREGERVLSRDGLTYEYTNKQGESVILPRPEAAIARQYLAMVRAFCGEFGLTPSSRGRMSVAGPPEQDPLDQMLRTSRN